MSNIPISRRYIVRPQKQRNIYLNRPFEGFFADKVYVEPDRWKRYLFNRNGYRPQDPQYVLKMVIGEYAHDIPKEIIIKPLPYSIWKLYRSFDNDPEAIAGLIGGAVISTIPESINLLNVVNKRPLFWRSLFEIIKTISTRDYEQKEELLAEKVQKASERFNTLDGVYDLFVFANFPEMYESYRKLDFFERIEMIALMQHVSGINMYENLMAYRKGRTKYLLFKPLDKKAITNKEAEEALKEHGFDRETISEAARELKEQIEEDKRSLTKKTINTTSENAAFMEVEI